MVVLPDRGGNQLVATAEAGGKLPVGCPAWHDPPRGASVATWDDAVVVLKGEALTLVNIERQVHALRTKAPPTEKGPPASPDLGEDDFEGVELEQAAE